MKFVKLLILAVILAIVAQVVHTVGAMLSMGYYTDPAYFPVWSKIMMPAAGPPPAAFMYTSFLFSLIGMFLFAYVYGILKSAVPGNTVVKKGLIFGLLITLVGAVPGYLACILCINLPLGLVAAWAAESLVIYLLNGMIVAKMV